MISNMGKMKANIPQEKIICSSNI